jgi:hypothetical protein
MGTGFSVEAPGTPRRRATSPPREPQQPSTAVREYGEKIAALEGYSNISFESDFMSEEFDKKHGVFADEKLALDGPKFIRIGSGLGKFFRYTSDVPYDDGTKRRELKLWVARKLADNGDWARYTVKYTREPGSVVGIELKPTLGTGRLKEGKIGRLERSLAQAEQNVMAPVIAQTKPAQSKTAISASRLICTETPYIRINGHPRVTVVMANITRAILDKVYTSPIVESRSYGVGIVYYGLTTRGRTKYASIVPEEFEASLLDSLMNYMTVLQDQGYKIHDLDSATYNDLLCEP